MASPSDDASSPPRTERPPTSHRITRDKLTSATKTAAALTNHRSPVLHDAPRDTMQPVPLEDLDPCVAGHSPNILLPVILCYAPACPKGGICGDPYPETCLQPPAVNEDQQHQGEWHRRLTLRLRVANRLAVLWMRELQPRRMGVNWVLKPGRLMRQGTLLAYELAAFCQREREGSKRAIVPDTKKTTCAEVLEESGGRRGR